MNISQTPDFLGTFHPTFRCHPVEAGYNLHRWRGEFRWKDADPCDIGGAIMVDDG